jgi:cyclase
VGERAFAYVQPVGGLCVSNAGLIVGDEGCIVIDALFAPSMTRAFQEEIRRTTDRPVRLLINTHHHVDHSLGNALFPEAVILSQVNARSEQQRVGVDVLELLRPRIPELVAECAGIEPRPADLTFEDELELRFEGRLLRLEHFGPAHTIGDALVTLPDAKLLFAGDVAFHRVTPLAFEGHVSGWISTCEVVDRMDVEHIVPGHGPVGGKGDLAEMRGYLALVRRQARAAFDAGLDEHAATAQVDLGPYGTWTEPERLPLNVARLYQEFRGEL